MDIAIILNDKRLFIISLLSYNPKSIGIQEKFTEIIVADDMIPSLSRISFPTKTLDNGNKLILCEHYSRPDIDLVDIVEPFVIRLAHNTKCISLSIMTIEKPDNTITIIK